MARESRKIARKRRHERIRKKVFGTPERPRLNIFRSAINIYAQVIDDESGRTLVQASTVDTALQVVVDGKRKLEQAELVGAKVAERALAAGINQVVFDRGGFGYHGRVKALADSARSAGLQF
jgi:large subunit ribosomal protein L18